MKGRTKWRKSFDKCIKIIQKPKTQKMIEVGEVELTLSSVIDKVEICLPNSEVGMKVLLRIVTFD